MLIFVPEMNIRTLIIQWKKNERKCIFNGHLKLVFSYTMTMSHGVLICEERENKNELAIFNICGYDQNTVSCLRQWKKWQYLSNRLIHRMNQNFIIILNRGPLTTLIAITGLNHNNGLSSTTLDLKGHHHFPYLVTTFILETIIKKLNLEQQ